MSTPKRIEVIDEQMAEVLRRKTDVERLRSVDAFWNSARTILRSSIRHDYPEWNDEQVNREIAHRISNGAVPRAEC